MLTVEMTMFQKNVDFIPEKVKAAIDREDLDKFTALVKGSEGFEFDDPKGVHELDYDEKKMLVSTFLPITLCDTSASNCLYRATTLSSALV